MTRICPQCEIGFKSKRPHGVCCSDECRYQRWIETNLDSPLNAFGRGLSQRDRVLHALRDAGSAGVRSDVFLGMGIPRAAARVKELREAGHAITSERERQFVRYALSELGNGASPASSHTVANGAPQSGASGAGTSLPAEVPAPTPLFEAPEKPKVPSAYDPWERAA